MGSKLTWFEILLVGVIVFGFIRGRKRGMSEEALDLVQWIGIVILGGLFYRPIGVALGDFIKFDYNLCFVVAYSFIAIALKILFTMIKRGAGGKLIQADTFGSFEYYLGMVAGVVRCLCILLMLMGFLHARYISPEDQARFAKMQQDNFGTISFPTIGSLQQTVFIESPAGKFITKHFAGQLISPVPPGVKPAPLKKRDSAVEDAINFNRKQN